MVAAESQVDVKCGGEAIRRMWREGKGIRRLDAVAGELSDE